MYVSSNVNDCSGHGFCTRPDQCTCVARFTGAACDACIDRHWGDECLPCPNCVHGNCNLTTGDTFKNYAFYLVQSICSLIKSFHLMCAFIDAYVYVTIRLCCTYAYKVNVNICQTFNVISIHTFITSLTCVCNNSQRIL